MNRHADKLRNDFIFGDRRFEERIDIEVSVRWEPIVEGRYWPHRFGVVALTSPTTPLQFSFKAERRFCTVAFSINTRLSEEQHRQLELFVSLMAYFTTSVSLSKHLGHHLRSIREALELSYSSIASFIRIPETTYRRWESGQQSPKGFEMYRWCQALGIVCPPNRALVRTIEFSPDLLRFLQEDPNRLRSLTPEQFERFVAERLDRMGYHVQLTGPTNRKDGGIDLIAVPKAANLGSVVIAGQMKHHRDRKTEREAVDRLLSWKDSYFGVGLLVTNTSFTKDAVWTAREERNRRFLRLREFTDLKRWLQDQYGTVEDWREIPDRVELAPGVVIEIPKPQVKSSVMSEFR